MKFIMEPLETLSGNRGCKIKVFCPHKVYYILPPW